MINDCFLVNPAALFTVHLKLQPLIQLVRALWVTDCKGLRNPSNKGLETHAQVIDIPESKHDYPNGYIAIIPGPLWLEVLVTVRFL